MPFIPRHKRQSLAPAAARTARAPLATPSASLTIQQANPKRPGTASHERYERYKGAKTLDELLELGGSRADFNHDKAKGFIVVDGEAAARSAHDPAERRAASGTKRAAADDESRGKKAAKPKKAAAAAGGQAKPEQWFVVTSHRPSSCGCHAGSKMSRAEFERQCTREDTAGPFASRAEAVAAAIAERDGYCEFEEWAPEFYSEGEPPFDSADGGNYDDDEYVSVDIESQAQRDARAAQLAKKAAKGSAKPAPALPPMPSAGGGFVGVQPGLSASAAEDLYLFSRAPADPLLGGVSSPPGRFPKGFVHAVGRESNACYAVAAFCAEPARGARYALKKFGGLSKEAVWVPPPGCARGGPRAPDAATCLVDQCSTDLWKDPSRCPCPHGFDAAALARACRARAAPVTHLFALGVVDADALVAAVDACTEKDGGGRLEVVCLNECAVTPALLGALARGHGASLKGVYLHQCKAPDGGGAAHDAAWAELLARARGLLWLEAGYVDLRAGAAFGPAAWRALDHPSLRVLAYDGSFGSGAFEDGGRGWLEAMAPLMAPAITTRLPNLVNVRIMPDMKGVSRVALRPYKVTPWPKPKPLPAFEFDMW